MYGCVREREKNRESKRVIPAHIKLLTVAGPFFSVELEVNTVRDQTHGSGLLVLIFYVIFLTVR